MRSRRTVLPIALAALLCAVHLGAQEAASPAAEEAEDSSRIAAGFWVDGAGKPDQGVAYDVLALESPLRDGKYWRLSLILGKEGGGMALATDLWSEKTRFGETTLSLGGAALTDEVAGKGWRPAAVVLLRVRRGETGRAEK